MKDKKKLNKVLRNFLFLLFFIYVTIFVSNELGYYDYQKTKQVTLTNEQIEKFEEDIKNGIDISIEDYVVDIKKDYQNTLSEASLGFSNFISKTVKKGTESVFNALGKFVSS